MMDGANADEAYGRLLRSIVEVARAIFAGAAASIFLLDEERDELVFEAVAGQGSGELVGRRFPAGAGIAGSVLATGQPLVVDDVQAHPRFDRESAESTGYVPTSLLAVPLLADERPLGVLEVLDRRDRSRSPLEDLELLGLFGEQAAIALALLRRARQAEEGRPPYEVAVLAAVLEGLSDDERESGRRLLTALLTVLDE